MLVKLFYLNLLIVIIFVTISVSLFIFMLRKNRNVANKHYLKWIIFSLLGGVISMFVADCLLLSNKRRALVIRQEETLQKEGYRYVYEKFVVWSDAKLDGFTIRKDTFGIQVVNLTEKELKYEISSYSEGLTYFSNPFDNDEHSYKKIYNPKSTFILPQMPDYVLEDLPRVIISEKKNDAPTKSSLNVIE